MLWSSYNKLTTSFVNSSVSILFISLYLVWIRPSSFILASMCLSNSKRFLLRIEFWSCCRDCKIKIWRAFISCYDAIIEKYDFIWFMKIFQTLNLPLFFDKRFGLWPFTFNRPLKSSSSPPHPQNLKKDLSNRH